MDDKELSTASRDDPLREVCFARNHDENHHGVRVG